MDKKEFNKKLAKILFVYSCMPFDLQIKFINELLEESDFFVKKA